MKRYFLKIFDRPGFADEFVKGTLYCKKLSYFKNYKDEDGRGDEYEGKIVLKKDNLEFNLDSRNEKNEIVSTFKFSAEEDIDQVEIGLNKLEDLYVFCMYSISIEESQSIQKNEVHNFKKKQELSEDLNNLGGYLVAITDNTEFMKRVQTCVDKEKANNKNKNFEFCRGPVTYYDIKVGLPLDWVSIKAIFAKQNKYEYQNEYRFVFDIGNPENDYYRFSIGDISDITTQTKTSEFNKLFNIRFPET